MLMLRQCTHNLVGIQLSAEGNYYRVNKQSGIWFYGDTEMMLLVLGRTMSLVYNWYNESQCTYVEYNLTLNRLHYVREGDIL